MSFGSTEKHRLRQCGRGCQARATDLEPAGGIMAVGGLLGRAVSGFGVVIGFNKTRFLYSSDLE